MHMSHKHRSPVEPRPVRTKIDLGRNIRNGRPGSRRVRGGQRNEHLPFVPPEDWYEPRTDAEPEKDYRIILQDPGEGYLHVVTPTEIRHRLSLLPGWMLRELEVVQLSRMTRKKSRFPCYGMQWGATLYLYPLETERIEYFVRPPTPAQFNEPRMFGGRWEVDSNGGWSLYWSDFAIKDFYLNNILIHELGHLLDRRNTGYLERERFAEWFAIEYGYKPSRSSKSFKRTVRRRHHSK